MRSLAWYGLPRAAAGIAVTLSLWPTGAHAERPASARPAPELRLAPGDCGGLDVSETERLLRTELAIVAARAERVRAPVVLVTCADNQVTIRVRDTRSRRTIEDTMPAPPEGQPGRERVIALAASQLFLSSWLGVVLAEERRPEAGRASAPAAPRARPPRREPPGAFRPELGLLAGVRLRRIQDAVPAAAARLDFGFGSRHVGFSLHAAGERTRTKGRDPVAYALLGGGAGIDVRFPAAALEWSAGARISGYWVRAGAESADRAARAVSASGSACEVLLGAGPSLSVAPGWRLGLDVQAGALVPEIVARVDGGPDVALHGAFAGLGLRLQYRVEGKR